MWLISSWLFAFMLFNFQGPVLYSLWWISHRSELVYYITLFSACQALFSKFFNFFLKPKFQLKSLVFDLLMSFLSSRVSLSRWQLIYNIMPKLICQHLFWKNPDFFQKSGKSPLFPLSMRIFDSSFHWNLCKTVVKYLLISKWYSV